MNANPMAMMAGMGDLLRRDGFFGWSAWMFEHIKVANASCLINHLTIAHRKFFTKHLNVVIFQVRNLFLHISMFIYVCILYIYICRCYHVRVNRVFVQKVDLYESPSSHEFLKGPNPANQILFPPDGSGSISKLDHPWCLPRKCQQ